MTRGGARHTRAELLAVVAGVAGDTARAATGQARGVEHARRSDVVAVLAHGRVGATREKWRGSRGARSRSRRRDARKVPLSFARKCPPGALARALDHAPGSLAHALHIALYGGTEDAP